MAAFVVGAGDTRGAGVGAADVEEHECDGGGNRIAVVLWILEHIESIMGRPTWLHAYDYIGGISSGGVLAILVSDSKALESAISSNLKRSAGNWAGDIR